MLKEFLLLHQHLLKKNLSYNKNRNVKYDENYDQLSSSIFSFVNGEKKLEVVVEKEEEKELLKLFILFLQKIFNKMENGSVKQIFILV
jgi:hypothetical protein